MLTFAFIIKDVTKDTDEQPDVGELMTRSGRVPSAGASILVELGYVEPSVPVKPPARECTHKALHSSNLVVQEFLPSLICSPSLPFPRDQLVELKIPAFSSLDFSGEQPPS